MKLAGMCCATITGQDGDTPPDPLTYSASVSPGPAYVQNQQHAFFEDAGGFYASATKVWVRAATRESPGQDCS